ncbi:MAG: RNA 2'-phosphotransferase [Bacteroidota bacterium]
MNPKNIVRISRKISLVLRHKPKAIGLQLDPHGWAQVDDLLRLMTASGTPLSRPDLEQIVAENNKQRFRFSEDGTKIRANQGHSIDIDLQLKPQTPPPVLYHGTASTSVASIMSTGLHSRKRQHVHLSHDTETATMVGKRHGKPVILRVDAAAMASDGYEFFCSENGVWLTHEVPVKYLRLDK